MTTIVHKFNKIKTSIQNVDNFLGRVSKDPKVAKKQLKMVKTRKAQIAADCVALIEDEGFDALGMIGFLIDLRAKEGTITYAVLLQCFDTQGRKLMAKGGLNMNHMRFIPGALCLWSMMTGNQLLNECIVSMDSGAPGVGCDELIREMGAG